VLGNYGSRAANTVVSKKTETIFINHTVIKQWSYFKHITVDINTEGTLPATLFHPLLNVYTHSETFPPVHTVTNW